MLEKAGCTKWKSEQNQRILLGCWRTRQPQWLQPLRRHAEIQWRNPCESCFLGPYAVLVLEPPTTKHPSKSSRDGKWERRIEVSTKAEAVRKPLFFTMKNADSQRVHSETRSETSRKPLFFVWGNRCMCIFIKVETARKPLFFTMKNADSRFGAYITLSYREGKPVACYASAVLWGKPLGSQAVAFLRETTGRAQTNAGAQYYKSSCA
jgi:hypothetical protein